MKKEKNTANWSYAMEETTNPTPMASTLALLLFLGISTASAGAADHRYNRGDSVPLYANKIGPFHNPTETYRYYDLPFCCQGKVEEKKETLGEVLNGDHQVVAPYRLDFLVGIHSKLACKKLLSREEVAKFRNAVKNDYYYQMYYDDLPIWGFIGSFSIEGDIESGRPKYRLYNTVAFQIYYQNDRVIEINLRTEVDGSVDITQDREVEVEFSYSVKWMETSVPFEKRMDRYLMSSSHQRNTQWFLTVNSCLLVLLLMGLLSTILIRVLKNELAKYANNDDLITDQEETGWKNIHGDVFRYPKNKSLLAAFLGSGTQLLAVASSILILSLFGVFPPYNRGALTTTVIFIYTLTSVLAGYMSTSFYCQLEGTDWVKTLILTHFLFSGPLFLTFCFLNTIAIMYNAIAAIPFSTICILVLVWVLLAFPLLVLGGIAGKNRKVGFNAPCHTNKCPREIPQRRWYQRSILRMVVAGVLPFIAIHIQLYYILASMWGHKIYAMYDLLFIVFIILLIVTAFVSVALSYFQLASEDHEWWWRSLFYGGATALFVYGYCFYFYYARSAMSGLLQTSFFFGYMACISYGVFLMLGTVGFGASLLFIRRIYGSIKCE